MSAPVFHLPPGGGLAGTTWLVWSASQALLRAVRTGDRARAEQICIGLANTREDRRCTPALARLIGSCMEIALRTFGGEAPAQAEKRRGAA